MKLVILLLSGFLSFSIVCTDPDARKDNKALRKKLFLDQDYDPTRIPLKNGQQKLNITTFIWVLRLASFDVYESKAELEIFLHLIWYDDYLKWDPKKFNGIDSIILHPWDIWTPGLSTSLQKDDPSGFSFPIRLYNNGKVYWGQYMTITQKCEVNMINYPFDEHECIFFYFPTSDWNKISFTVSPKLDKSAEVENDDQYVNPEFSVKLLNEGIFPLANISDKFNNTNIVLVLLQISRKTSSYLFKVMIPYIVANLMMAFALITPSNIPKRVACAVLTMLIDLMIFEHLWDSIGNTMYTPYAIKCLIINMTMVMFFMATSILCNQMISATRKPCPSVLQTIVRNKFYGKILFLHFSVKDLNDLDEEMANVKANQSNLINDWTLVSILLDRVLLLIFIISLFFYHS